MRLEASIEPRIEALESLSRLATAAGSAALASKTTFVYRPGGITANNVFATWAALYAQLTAMEGPKVVQIDDSIVSPAIIPAGTWDLNNCTLIGRVRSLPTNAQCADGCVLQNLAQLDDNVTLISVSTAPVLTLTDGSVLILERGCIISSALGAAPFISAPGPYTTAPVIILGFGAAFGPNPGQTMMQITDLTTGVIAFVTGIGNGIANDTIVGPGALILFLLTPVSVQALSGATPTQAGLTTLFVLDPAADVASYFSEALGVLGVQTSVPVGYSLATTTSPAGVRSLTDGILQAMVITANGGGPGNIGLTVLFEVRKNGVPIPNAFISIPADLGGGGFVTFLEGFNGGDYIQLTATPSAPLAAPITGISATIS